MCPLLGEIQTSHKGNNFQHESLVSVTELEQMISKGEKEQHKNQNIYSRP